MEQNICKFIPYHKDTYSIHTINLVLETKPQIYSSLQSSSVYKIHLVCSGTGKLHISGKVVSLTKGDIFFTFPGIPHCIESVDSFTYMYVSFLGTRANMILDKLLISPQNFLFHECDAIQSFWENGLNTIMKTADLIAESILLYSFYFLGNNIIAPETKDNAEQNNSSFIVKKYIDDNFSRPKLSLESISTELSYSPKYISSVFKKRFKIGITEYLNTIRIQNACTLISQGFTNVTDIAYRCGYTDPQYFSKVFKKRIGVSPKSYIQNTMIE